jgi:malate dehydrogenase (oxaloacetate-decarboxylating)(NADP+)
MLRLKSLYSRWLECDWGGAQDDRRQRPRRACQDQHLPVIGSAGWALKLGLEDSNSKMASTPRGLALLRDPQFNKSTAFTESEREALGLLGLLPEGIDSEAAQIRRVHLQLSQKPNDLEKYIYLSQLQDTDETLFFCVLMSDPVQFLPLVYTPTVGEACLQFGHIMRRPKGLYLSIKRKGRVREILRNWPQRDVRFIVVSSGQRILGLGDLGANGMGIPIGKLALYTACAGVPPQYSLPILIDCGTNNETLLRDPLYLGLRQTRPPVAQLDEFVEEFITAVQDDFPNCCVQFEDWAGADAIRLLARYRDRICCFNDDIQGTAAVALAGILGALRTTGGKLSEQTFLFLGAGSAAIGISGLLTERLMLEGISAQDARARLWLFDINGLLESTRSDLADFHKPYAHRHSPTRDFVDAIESLKPTAIIGVSTVGKAFNQRVIETMARINRRPIIFACSNPTSHSECSADEAYRWSEGRAIFASGSPFPPVLLNGKTYVPGQGNNIYIFPAIGLAVYATHATRVTNEMFIAAARAVAEQVTPAQLDAGLIYPPVSTILDTELYAAERVAEVIFARGLARVPAPKDIAQFIRSQIYKPEYHLLG